MKVVVIVVNAFRLPFTNVRSQLKFRLVRFYAIPP